MHIRKNILNGEGRIDPEKIDQVARMGGNWYTRAKSGLLEVPKPLNNLGIGVDGIPEHIRQSNQLSGNDLGKLGNIEELPTAEEITSFISANPGIKEIVGSGNEPDRFGLAKEFLSKNEVLSAWKVLLAKL
jgi:hypothetical protein